MKRTIPRSTPIKRPVSIFELGDFGPKESVSESAITEAVRYGWRWLNRVWRAIVGDEIVEKGLEKLFGFSRDEI